MNAAHTAAELPGTAASGAGLHSLTLYTAIYSVANIKIYTAICTARYTPIYSSMITGINTGI